MRVIVAAAAAFAAMAVAQPASAQDTGGFVTAGQLLEECQADEEWCQAYIMGVIDGLTSYARYAQAPRILCIPAGTESGTIIDLVLAHLEANPDRSEYDAPSQVMRALLNAYPCNRT